MMISGMIAALNPTPLPGASRNHRNASKSANPATMIANCHAHSWSDQRPAAAASQRDTRADGEPCPKPALLEGRKVSEDPEPVEAKEPQAQVQPIEAGQGPEEADDRDEDGWVSHMGSPSNRDVMDDGEHSPLRTVGGTPFSD